MTLFDCRRLFQLETSISGPYHDLPDIPEARQAGDCVVEIDALVLAGNGLEAFRRFRQLTGKTWDEAHATIPTWFDLKRAEVGLLRLESEGKA